MGGEGQIHATLGKVCMITFPQTTQLPRILLDADYLCTIGMKLFDTLFHGIPCLDQELRLCRINDDRVEWIENDTTLLKLFEEEAIQCQSLHAIYANELTILDTEYVVESQTSPEFSPEIICPKESISNMREEATYSDKEFIPEDSLSLEEQSLPDMEEQIPELSTSTRSNLFDSIRMFFDPKLKPKEVSKETMTGESSSEASGRLNETVNEVPTHQVKENWWSASTRFLMKPFEGKKKVEEIQVETSIPDMTYRHSEPIRPLSASYQVQFPRMTYTTPNEQLGSNHNFHISSSWHQHAERMSASVRLPAKEKKTSIGSFVWI